MNPAFKKPEPYTARSLDDKIIVSCGTEAHYFEQLHSTREHCAKYAPEAWQLFYYGYPDGCPTQFGQQYAFKIHALRRAFDAGFAVMLWIDAAFQPIGSLAPLWKIVKEKGWYIQAQGDAMLGNWCSDAALGTFEIERDTAMEIPLCYSGLVGLDIRNQTGNKIYTRWCELFDRGAFNGPHLNTPGSFRPWGTKYQGFCSDDPRCQGHRHDEAALSFILWEMGLAPCHEPFIDMGNGTGFIGHHRKLICP